MKKTLILLLAFMTPSISQCQPYQAYSLQDIAKHPIFIVSMVAGPVAYCFWKAYKGSKPAKIISKTLGTAALAFTALAGAALAVDASNLPASSATPTFMLTAAIAGFGTCLATAEVIQDIKDWNLGIQLVTPTGTELIK